MRNLQQRLQALEQTVQRKPVRGLRLFDESTDEPGVFYEGIGRQHTGQAFTMSEIDALGAAGWQCILVCRESSRQADPT